MSGKHVLAAIAALIIVSRASDLSAQVTSASLRGKIKDATGGVLAGVTVTAKDTETGFVRTVVTDSAGSYQFSNLAPGTYEFAAELPGFKRLGVSRIPLSVGQDAVVAATLELGEISQQVTVTGDVPLIDTKSASLSGLVAGETVRTLPLNGRSFDQLALLNPGVTSYDFGGRNVQMGSGQKMSISGARPESIYFLLDGTNILDHSDFTPGSAAGNNLGVDAIREFRVFTHNYSAEIGVRSGGAVSVISRSGTNEYHGSAYEFVRNSAFDARNFFDPVTGPPSFQRNQFGFSLGGPIVPQKIQFFTNFEWLRERLGRTLIAIVPTALARQGTLPTQNVQVSPAIGPYLSLYPPPNGRDLGDGTGEYRDSYKQPTDENYGMARIDYALSTNDTVFVRYTSDSASVASPQGDLARYLTLAKSRNDFLTAQETHIFRHNLLNEFRVAFNRTVPREDVKADPPIDPSLKFYDTAPNVGQLAFSSGQGRASAPISSIGIGGDAPRVFHQDIFQFTDNISHQIGRHLLHYGVDVQLLHINGLLNQSPSGQYSFSSLANLLKAMPSGVVALAPGSDVTRRFRETLVGSYIQDDLQFRPNLTLNFGLRHEFTTIPTEADGKISNLLKVTDPLPTLGVLLTTNNSLKDFAPRVGFAWDPWNNQRTSVRGGFGVFYSQVIGRNWYNYALRSTLFSGFVSDPAPQFPHPFINGVKKNLEQNDRIDPNLKTPTLYHFNLTVQRQIVRDMMIEVGYVGSRGRNLLRNYEGNTRIPQVLPDGTLSYPANAPRTNPNFGPIFTLVSDAHSWYNSLQARVTRPLSHGLQFCASYTFAKSIDEASTLERGQGQNSPAFTQIPSRPDLDKGLSAFDVRQSFSFNFAYDLPQTGLPSVAGVIFNGWQIGGIIRMQSGTPLGAETGFNQSGDGARMFADRPNLKAGATNNPILGNPSRWFDPTVFELPTPGFYGNVGRNTIIGPDLMTVDALLAKDFQVKEHSRLVFRAEVFNLLNRANFGLPRNKIFNSQGQILGSVGLITSTITSSRQVQLALKLTF